MEKITSLQNAKIKKWALLKQKKERDKTGLFLIEGEHLIEEALKADCVETILFDGICPFSYDALIQVTPEILNKLSQNVSGAKLIAVCRKKENVIKDPEKLILLDGVQDPGNLGTIIRTAISFGFDGIYCSKDTCDIYNEKVIRSTQGALFQLPVIYEDLHDVIPELQKEGMTVIGTSLQESKTMDEMQKEKIAIVLGNEGQGVHEDIIRLCDAAVRIEMNGFESLNVAVAGGILMYHYRKK